MTLDEINKLAEAVGRTVDHVSGYSAVYVRDLSGKKLGVLAYSRLVVAYNSGDISRVRRAIAFPEPLSRVGE